jgi:hypothetical protein
MTEVPGLPATGPTTLATACAELGYTVGAVPARDARLQLRVDAANSFVRSLPVASDSLTYGSPPPAWPSYVSLGTSMLATRLWRRKDSPSGVEAFTDQGAVYVSRNDPDIAQLLKLGNYTPPMVG